GRRHGGAVERPQECDRCRCHAIDRTKRMFLDQALICDDGEFSGELPGTWGVRRRVTPRKERIVRFLPAADEGRATLAYRGADGRRTGAQARTGRRRRGTGRAL